MTAPETAHQPPATTSRARPSPVHLQLYFPNNCTGGWVSAIPLSLAGAMISPDLDVRMWATSTEPQARRPYVGDTVPRLLWKALCRIDRPDWIAAVAERRYLRSLAPNHVAYVYPPTSLELLRRIKDRGHLLILERINCQESAAKAILDDAYRRLGLPGYHALTDQQVERSRQEVALADRLFSPSEHVTRSLVAEGIPHGRVFESSYGWNPDRLAGSHRAVPPADGLDVLFVGSVCVRKGAHLLLEAWARSGVRGRLIFAGRIEPLIADRHAGLLDRPDVVTLGHVSDVGAAYRSAQVFAFPTLEEGSPLVSYEAMGSGLAPVFSPMAAGAIARPDQEAIILDPYDVDAWAHALQRLAADPELIRHLGENARARALEFTWARVGARRRDQVLAWLDAGGR